MQARILVDSEICGGKPYILGMLAGGYAMKQILHAYPELSHEDIVAATEAAT